MRDAPARCEEAHRRAEARLGLVLEGGFRLDGVLGVGGLAAVYAATSATGERVAIKLLHPELCVYKEMRSRLKRESLVAHMLNHPGVVRVKEDHVPLDEDGDAFLVMEQLSGETLEELRARQEGGALGERFVLTIAAETLAVLAAAHALGIIHRDITPQNLFVTSDERVKVLDFGMASLPEGTPYVLSPRPGLALGTPGFMPPEQAEGRWDFVDGRSDLWSLGATMFTLLTGQKVHGEGATMRATLAAAIHEKAPPLGSVAPGASEGLSRVVDRALSFCPEERWSSAQAMLRAVREALSRG